MTESGARERLLLLFDCDGTLVDSQHIISDAMASTFSEHGLPEPTIEATRGVIGLSLPIAIGTLLGEPLGERDARMADSYRRHFQVLRSAPGFVEPLFPGAAECLARLSTRSELVLGMVTGKSRRGVRSVCAFHGLEETFRVVRTADECVSKPHPSMVLECCEEARVAPSRTIVVGDTRYDMEMAAAAGAGAIGVGWGYHNEAELVASGASIVIDSFDDLEGAVEALAFGRDAAAAASG